MPFTKGQVQNKVNKKSQSPSGFSLTFAPKLLHNMLFRLLYKKATLAYTQPKTFRAVNQHLIVLLVMRIMG